MKPVGILTIIIISGLLSGCTSQGIVEDSSETNVDFRNTSAPKYFAERSEKFNEPWPTNVSKVELTNTALFETYEYLALIKQSDCSYSANIFPSESIPPEQVEVTKEILDSISNIFCKYLNKDFSVFLGNYDFAMETISEENIDTNLAKGCKPQALYCVYDNAAQIGGSLGRFDSGELILDPAQLETLSHEVFHLVQGQLDPDPAGEIPPRGHESLPFRPVWFVEGTAEYFGRVLPTYSGHIKEYRTFTTTDRSGLPLPVIYLSQLSSMEEWGNGPGGGSENYYSGHLAVKYLIASVGAESFFKIWEDLSRGEAFDEAFEDETGVSLSDFYDKFYIMHNNLYDGAFAED